jgi:uncharacterized protein (TIGR00251 family)
MIAVVQQGDGVVLPVRAKPGAKRDAVLDEHNGFLRLAVTAAPEHGRANDAIVRVLADALGLRRSQISLVAGATSRNKKLLVADITVDDLMARIDAVLAPTMFESTDPEL